jgi:hypothetical protein
VLGLGVPTGLHHQRIRADPLEVDQGAGGGRRRSSRVRATAARGNQRKRKRGDQDEGRPGSCGIDGSCWSNGQRT